MPYWAWHLWRRPCSMPTPTATMLKFIQCCVLECEDHTIEFSNTWQRTLCGKIELEVGPPMICTGYELNIVTAYRSITIRRQAYICLRFSVTVTNVPSTSTSFHEEVVSTRLFLTCGIVSLTLHHASCLEVGLPCASTTGQVSIVKSYVSFR